MKPSLKVKVSKNSGAPHDTISHKVPGALSLPRMSLGANCWKAGAMCSLRPLMSWPEAASLAILWASLSFLVRGLSPVVATSKLNTSTFFFWPGCFCVRCWAIELRCSLARIWASWLLILAWAETPVSPCRCRRPRRTRCSSRHRLYVCLSFDNHCAICLFSFSVAILRKPLTGSSG